MFRGGGDEVEGCGPSLEWLDGDGALEQLERGAAGSGKLAAWPREQLRGLGTCRGQNMRNNCRYVGRV